MGHDHSHHHHTSNIKVAFFLNLGFTIFELIGGIYVNSVAILSDALHDLGDSLALGLAWYLEKKSKKEATDTFTFGYQRFSLLGALINSIILIVGSIFVVKEAIERLFSPEVPNAQGMLLFAIVGVLVNGYAAYKVSHGTSLNERVVSWHLIEDVLGWVAVLIVSIILLFKNIPYLDPALSIGITLFILWNVGKRLKEIMLIFLQRTPTSIDIDVLKKELQSIQHVTTLQHTHIWSLDGEHHVFATHVKLKGITNLKTLLHVKKELNKTLQPYHFKYHTIEIEVDSTTLT